MKKDQKVNPNLPTQAHGPWSPCRIGLKEKKPTAKTGNDTGAWMKVMGEISLFLQLKCRYSKS
jgi:hypothetical protein